MLLKFARKDAMIAAPDHRGALAAARLVLIQGNQHWIISQGTDSQLITSDDVKPNAL
jgi:hypothetical protein